MKPSNTLALLSSSLTLTTASVINFWANPNCDGGLEIEAVDFPSEARCSLLNLRGGTSALSAKAPNEIPSDCAIELYKNTSCNTLEAVFDWGIDQGDVCRNFNAPGPIAYQTFCRLNDKRRRARRAVAMGAEQKEGKGTY